MRVKDVIHVIDKSIDTIDIESTKGAYFRYETTYVPDHVPLSIMWSKVKGIKAPCNGMIEILI